VSRIYSAFAAILPVSLGLGLIYLCTMDQMQPLAALTVILGMAVSLPLVAYMAKLARDELTYGHAPYRSIHVLPAVDGDVRAGDERGFVGR
jgi:hypothetical protein